MDPIIDLESPLMVDFEITNRCPYRCTFCEADITHKSFIHELNTRECFHILEKLSNAGIFNIFLTGGEPLLRSDLPDLIKYCFTLGLEPFTSTNALYLDSSKIEKLINVGLNRLQVSIQGPEIVHESIVKNPKSYLRVMKNLENAVKAGIEVEVVCVGLKENIKYIPVFIREIKGVGVKYFRVLRYIPAHRKEMLEHIPTKSMVEEYIPKITKAAKENDIDLLLSFCPGLAKSPSFVFEGVHPATTTCPAGKIEFTILSDGNVYPCMEFRNRPEMYIGNILSSSVTELWNHPKMTMLRRLTPMDYTGICGGCERKFTCYSARCVAYNLTNDLYGDDLSCYLVNSEICEN